MSEKKGLSRNTDSLLHPGRGHSPSYGLNDDSIEDESVEDGGVRLDILHSRERIWTMAVFSLIACNGSLLIGMSLGYSTNTLAELSDLYNDGDMVYGIKKDSWPASLFGVSLNPEFSIVTDRPAYYSGFLGPWCSLWGPCCVAPFGEIWTKTCPALQHGPRTDWLDNTVS